MVAQSSLSHKYHDQRPRRTCLCRSAPRTLTHLQALEAESIHIIREVAAEFAKPVMLYSIGKDSSVMLRLAQKAFYPGPIPFPLLHIDTQLQIPRDARFPRHLPERASAPKSWSGGTKKRMANGANPFTLGTQKCCALLKTRSAAGRSGELGVRCGVRRRPSRRREIAREGTDLLVPRCVRAMGPEEPAAGVVEPLQRPHRQRRVDPRLSAFELDRARRVAVHPSGKHSDRSAVFRERARDARARRHADPGRAQSAAAARREDADGDVAHALARLHVLHGRDPVDARRRFQKIIGELFLMRRSERENRVIDHDQEGSMEMKKREGYF